PRYHEDAEAFGVGGSTDQADIGEAASVRPGSWSRAKMQDGSPGNLRGPARIHVQSRRKWEARWQSSTASGAPRRTRRLEGHMGSGSEHISDRRMREREVVAPS